MDQIDPLAQYSNASQSGPAPVASPSLGDEEGGVDPLASYSEEARESSLQSKRGTLPQQAIAWAEALGRGTISPPLATAIETHLLRVPGKDILEREEANPATRFLGETAGIVASPFGKLLGVAGKGAAELVGFGREAGLAAKIGSSAVRGATENALYQSGDEASKYIAGGYDDVHPGQAAQIAATNIGLSSLFGGTLGAGFGALHPAWEATAGKKLGGTLNALTRRLNGESLELPSEIEQIKQDSNLEVPPELNSALSNDPNLVNKYQTLKEQQLGPGLKLQKTVDDFNDQAQQSILDSFGKTKEQVEGYSENKQGHDAIDAFKQEYKNKSEPIEKEYNALKEPFQNMPLTPEAYGTELGYKSRPSITDSLSEKVAQFADQNGYNMPGTPSKNLLDYTLAQLPKQQTLTELQGLASRIGQQSFAEPTLRDFGKNLSKIFLEAQNDFLESKMGEQGSELFGRFQNVRKAYSELMSQTNDLSSELSLGKPGGPKDFLRRLDEKRSPEEFLKKLSPKGNADIIQNLRESGFQGTLEKIRENELFKILKPAVTRANEAEKLSPKLLFNAVDKISQDPQISDFVLPPDAKKRVDAIKFLLNKVNDRSNPSGTAGTLTKLLSKLPSSAIAAAEMLTGHNPVMGYLVGKIAESAMFNVPAAVNLALLKFLGSAGEVNPAGFRMAAESISNVMKGTSRLNSAISNVFKAGSAVLPDVIRPKDDDLKKLDKHLRSVQTNPGALLDVGGDTAHYMPDHGMELSKLASNAASYLNSLRPVEEKQNPLDPEIKPSQAENDLYYSQLEIAEQPLLVLEKAKEGTLTGQDVQTVATIYPQLLGILRQKITNEIMDVSAKGDDVAYNTRLGLSMILGHPVDSTFTSSSIISNQLAFQPEAPAQQPNGKAQKSTLGGLEKLKVANRSETKEQSIEEDEA